MVRFSLRPAGIVLVAAAALTSHITTGVSAQTSSPKRGLVYVPLGHPIDDTLWDRPTSSITWYYNYQAEPSEAYADHSQDNFEFVPMLWGATSGTEFYDSVAAQIQAGRKITHVLGFNEPDGPHEYGGSDMLPSAAADVWVKNFEPLAALGVKLGLPAITGAYDGMAWLQQFLGNCSEIVSEAEETPRNCTYDFLNLHWYGNFEGLAGHMGRYSAAFPNVTQWITEYALAESDLGSTQTFFNMSMEYFDRMESVGRYSYFGAFRSQYSNVGPNAVFLNNDGELTDIGSWYLGGHATGIDPQSGLQTSRGNKGRSLSSPVAIATAAVATAAIAVLS